MSVLNPLFFAVFLIAAVTVAALAYVSAAQPAWVPAGVKTRINPDTDARLVMALTGWVGFIAGSGGLMLQLFT